MTRLLARVNAALLRAEARLSWRPRARRPRPGQAVCQRCVLNGGHTLVLPAGQLRAHLDAHPRGEWVNIQATWSTATILEADAARRDDPLVTALERAQHRLAKAVAGAHMLHDPAAAEHLACYEAALSYAAQVVELTFRRPAEECEQARAAARSASAAELAQRDRAAGWEP